MVQVTEEGIRKALVEMELAEASLEARLFAAAGEVFGVLLGREWLRRHVISDKSSTYLRFRGESVADRYRNQDRFSAFAEMLFNFQAHPGFEKRLCDIASREPEDAIGELEGAKILARSGTAFRFVEPQGRKGADYDVLAQIGDLEVPVEMKCKLETTECSSQSVQNTMRDVRTQLPKDSAGVVFMKVPEIWGAAKDLPSVIDQAVELAFRNTSRISVAVFHWERWAPILGGGAARITFYTTRINPRARIPLPSEAIVRPFGSPVPLEWWRPLSGLVS